MHIIGYLADGSSRRVVAIKGDAKIIKAIIIRFKRMIIGAIENMTFFPRVLPRATMVEMAIGKPSCVKAIKREYVGITRLCKFTPSGPISLVTTILMIKPRLRVAIDPISKIKALLKNRLFFIVEYILKH